MLLNDNYLSLKSMAVTLMRHGTQDRPGMDSHGDRASFYTSVVIPAGKRVSSVMDGEFNMSL